MRLSFGPHGVTHTSIRNAKQGKVEGKSRESPDAMHEVQVVNHLQPQDLGLNGSLKAKYEDGGDTIPFPKGGHFSLVRVPHPLSTAQHTSIYNTALSTDRRNAGDNPTEQAKFKQSLDTNQATPSHKCLQCNTLDKPAYLCILPAYRIGGVTR